MMPLEQKPVLGGLNTKAPPTLLDPGTSPDLLNVLFTDGAIEKRPGFTPLFKDRLYMNAVRNTAYRTTAKVGAGGADVEYLRVYGALYAGHRTIYEGMTDLTVEFFHQVADELPLTNGNDGSSTTATTIKVRPLLSKGPVKRTFDTATASESASAAWNTTADTVWGNHAGSGMPFCVYLYNDSGVWQFRAAAHYYNVAASGAWSLQVVTSNYAVVPGARYHIIASFASDASSSMAIRVGRVIKGQATVYTTVTLALDEGTLAWNKCPIQLFDCPQQFIEAITTGSATQRPGLHLIGSAGNIGAFGDMTRAEGLIEDVVVWNSDKAISTGACDRATKLLPATGMINYWPMLKGGSDYTEDAIGLGNHLYLSPAGPIYDAASGGIDTASWFFNGVTSYASLNLGAWAPYWRWCKDRTVMAAMSYLVINNKAHGLAADVWVDSIEPQFEQVIAEIHGAMRLVITTSGTFAVYCRTGSGSAGAAQDGLTYQLAVTGTTVATPGSRYSVSALRANGGTSLSLYINGVLDATGTSLTAAHASGHGLGCVTIGMGSWEILTRGASATDTDTLHWNYINTDQRSGFFGRVECFRVLCGEDAAALYKNATAAQDDGDFTYDDARQWSHTAGSATLAPADAKDMVRAGNCGFMAYLDGHEERGERMIYAVASQAANAYTLHTTATDLLTTTTLAGNEVITAGGVKFFHQLAYFRFNVDPRREQATGFYQLLEHRYSSATYNTLTQAVNAIKGVHTQRTTCEDQTGFLGNVDMHCIESDLLYENRTQVVTTRYQERNRPFGFSSPWEIRPAFTQGIVRPLPGQCEVTLIADWEQQEAQERYTITASGRNLYWARPLWRADSPFQDVTPACVEIPGGYGSHLYHQGSAAGLALQGTGPKTTVVFECWVKPRRMDGRRWLAGKVDLTLQTVNWGIAMVDGGLEVFGTEGLTYLWVFSEGAAAAAATAVQRTSAVRANAWNHVHVTIGPGSTGCQVRVNGRLVSMVANDTLAGAGERDTFDTAESDAQASPIYVGSLPAGQETTLLQCNAIVDTVQWRFQAMDARLSDLRVTNDQDTAAWPEDEDGLPPTDRLANVESPVDDGDLLLYLPLDEGEGWLLLDGSINAEHAHADIEHFKLIAEGLDESTGSRYEHVAFRDRLMLTNGRSDPLQVRVTNRLADPPLVVERLGVDVPLAYGTGVAAGTTAGAGVDAADYVVWMTCVTFDGHESEPIILATYTLSGAVLDLVLKLTDVPRSVDPQVTNRNFYMSAAGGGVPIFTRQQDNVGTSINIEIPLTGTSPTAGENLPAPRGRRIAVAGSSIIIADLIDVAAGQNALAVSTPGDAAAFTVTSTVVLDSEDGKPIIGVKGNLGQFIVSKRDSIYSVSIGAVVSASAIEGSIRPVVPDDGIGGGAAVVGGLITGAGDRGVFAFAGGTIQYLSEMVEPTWRTQVDRSDDALRAMTGVYVRGRSEYWLSFRLRGAAGKEAMLVLTNSQPARWSLLSVPEHVTMARVDEPLRQGQDLAIGTVNGSILKLNREVSMDGLDGEAVSQGTTTYHGTYTAVTYVITGSSTSLTIPSGRFPTNGGGLAGAVVSLVHNGITEERTIARNTATTLTWAEPLTGWTVYTSFAIGGYSGYWTSPWISSGSAAGEQSVNAIDVEMLPNTGSLVMDLASIRQGDAINRAFPATYERFDDIVQTVGWTFSQQKPRKHAIGHWHRVRISTDGPATPFGVVAYRMEFRSGKAVGHTGRIA